MYRIIFDYKTARFVVQIVSYQMFWRKAEGMEYGTFDEAVAAVKAVGLDKLYENKSADQYRIHMRPPQPTVYLDYDNSRQLHHA